MLVRRLGEGGGWAAGGGPRGVALAGGVLRRAAGRGAGGTGAGRRAPRRRPHVLLLPLHRPLRRALAALRQATRPLPPPLFRRAAGRHCHRPAVSGFFSCFFFFPISFINVFK